MEPTDQQLILCFVRERSENGFSELTRRHLNLVYGTARRLVGDPETARLEGFRIRSRRENSPDEVAFEIERMGDTHTVPEVWQFVRIGDAWKCKPEIQMEPDTP